MPRYLGANWSQQAFLGEVSLAQNYGGRRYGGPPTTPVSTLPSRELTEEQLEEWEGTHGAAPPGSHDLRPHPGFEPPPPVPEFADDANIDPEFTPPPAPPMTTDSRAAFEEPVPVVNEMPTGEPIATPSAAPPETPDLSPPMTDPGPLPPRPPVASHSAAAGTAAEAAAEEALGELANRYDIDELAYEDTGAEFQKAVDNVLSDLPEHRRGPVETVAKEAHPDYKWKRESVETFSALMKKSQEERDREAEWVSTEQARKHPEPGVTQTDDSIGMTPTQGGGGMPGGAAGMPDIGGDSYDPTQGMVASGMPGGGGQSSGGGGGIPGMDPMTPTGGGGMPDVGGGGMPTAGGGMPDVGGGGMPDVGGGDPFDPMATAVPTGMPAGGAGDFGGGVGGGGSGMFGVRRIGKDSFFGGGL